MSTDPALAAPDLPAGVMSAEKLPLIVGAVYLFDFDGVISSGIEDAVYKLPPVEGEEEALEHLSRVFNINCRGMEIRYQRHLLFQAAALMSNKEISPGPCLDSAGWCKRNAKLFILSARSGWAATQRLRAFITEHDLMPVELYQVGRVEKALQIRLVCSEFPDLPVFFVEDSSRHLLDASKLTEENLRLVHVSPLEVHEAEVRALYKRVVDRYLDNRSLQHGENLSSE